MNSRILAFMLLATALLVPAMPAQAESGMAIAPEVCLECHDDVVSPVTYGASVHGQNACTSCHVEVTSLDAHMSGDVMPEEPKCVRCHKKESSEHFSSVHQLNDVTCSA